MKRWLRRGLLVAVIAFAAIQAVPYGWRHSNPPVLADAPWPNAEGAALARGSCYACHSNETDWPAYSYVAPMSWLVRQDVEAGRDRLNFSEWGEDSDVRDAAETVAEGSMPPRRYTMLHSGGHLSDAERRVLIAALETMDRDERDGRGSGDSEDDND